MKRFVVDASVAMKWFLPSDQEPLAEQAHRVLAAYVNGETALSIPDLFFAECGNILWKAERQGRCDATTTEQALSALLDAGFTTFPSAPLLRSAMRLARAFECTVYDSLYVALAREQGATLVTADSKLVNAVGGKMPVIWLGTV